MTMTSSKTMRTTVLAALAGVVALLGLLAGPAGAQTAASPTVSGGARATNDSVASGTCVATNDSVCSGSGSARNDSTSSGDAVAVDGSVASGCSTAVDDSTASGADCAPVRVTTVVPPGAPGGTAARTATTGQLARTGADLDALAASAAASVVMGGVFLALGRRRKPAGV
jgi:hypothetical protein